MSWFTLEFIFFFFLTWFYFLGFRASPFQKESTIAVIWISVCWNSSGIIGSNSFVIDRIDRCLGHIAIQNTLLINPIILNMQVMINLCLVLYAFIRVTAHHGQHLSSGTLSSSAEECNGGTRSQIDESVRPSGGENMPSLLHRGCTGVQGVSMQRRRLPPGVLSAADAGETGQGRAWAPEGGGPVVI